MELPTEGEILSQNGYGLSAVNVRRDWDRRMRCTMTIDRRCVRKIHAQTLSQYLLLARSLSLSLYIYLSLSISISLSLPICLSLSLALQGCVRRPQSPTINVGSEMGRGGPESQPETNDTRRGNSMTQALPGWFMCVIQRETCGKLRRRLGELVTPAQCERTRPDSNKIYEPCGYAR